MAYLYTRHVFSTSVILIGVIDWEEFRGHFATLTSESRIRIVTRTHDYI